MNDENAADGGLNLGVSVVLYATQWLLLCFTLYVNSLVVLMARGDSLSMSLELMVGKVMYIIV